MLWKSELQLDLPEGQSLRLGPDSTLIIEKYSTVTNFLCKPHENVMSESHQNIINIICEPVLWDF